MAEPSEPASVQGRARGGSTAKGKRAAAAGLIPRSRKSHVAESARTPFRRHLPNTLLYLLSFADTIHLFQPNPT